MTLILTLFLSFPASQMTSYKGSSSENDLFLFQIEQSTLPHSEMCSFICCRLINGLKGQHTNLKNARFLFYGAGSSAVGVAQLLALLLEKEGGQSKEQAWKVGSSLPIWILPISTPLDGGGPPRCCNSLADLRHLPVQGACRSRRASTVRTGLHCTQQVGTGSGS